MKKWKYGVEQVWHGTVELPDDAMIIGVLPGSEDEGEDYVAYLMPLSDEGEEKRK